MKKVNCFRCNEEKFLEECWTVIDSASHTRNYECKENCKVVQLEKPIPKLYLDADKIKGLKDSITEVRAVEENAIKELNVALAELRGIERKKSSFLGDIFSYLRRPVEYTRIVPILEELELIAPKSMKVE